MTWLLVIVLIGVMGGIAVVAAGRGAPMAEEHDDRPDAGVPAEGPLSAADLRRVRLSIAFRGYRMSEVDALLDRLAREREDPDHAADHAADHASGPSDGPPTGPGGTPPVA